MSTAGGRRYRLGPLVQVGLFGAMPLSQVVTLAVGGGLSFVGLLLRLVPWALIPFAVAAVVAFKRVDGWALHEWLPLKFNWWRRRGERRWFRAVPLLGATATAVPVSMPAALAGLVLLDVDVAWLQRAGRRAGMGVVHDGSAGLVTAVLRVHGDGQFALFGPGQQDVQVGLWGNALAGFCREATPVVRVGWTEWLTTAPVTSEPTAMFAVSDVDAADPVTAARRVYGELLAREAPAAVRHDVLVTVTVDVSRVQRRRATTSLLASGLATLAEEVRSFTARLESAGLRVDAPLSPADITVAVRARSNPSERRAPLASLAAVVGVSAGDFAPMAVVEDFGHVRVDAALHRSYWVAGWPRLDVPAAWMDLLLVTDRPVTRTLSVVFEPIPPSLAAQAVDEAAVVLEASELAKTKRGFRVRAADRRKRDEVDLRERELVSGFGDFAYAGFVHVTCGDLDDLDDVAKDVEDTATRAGVLLRPLDGRHGAGWVAGLPLGRTVAARRNAR